MRSNETITKHRLQTTANLEPDPIKNSQSTRDTGNISYRGKRWMNRE